MLEQCTVWRRDVRGAILRQDIREQERYASALLLADEQFREAFDVSPIGTAFVDLEGRWLYLNPALSDLLGYHAAEVYNRPFDSLPHAQDWQGEWFGRLRSGECKAATFEVRWRHALGHWVWTLTSVALMRDLCGEPTHFLVQFQDISDRKAAEAELLHRAFHDPLTDLPNRALFQDRLRQALANARRYQYVVAVSYLDLDHFKQVNDTFGHAAGDLLLQHVSWRLRTCVRESDTLARLGGDEFAIISPHAPEQHSTDRIARKLIDVFREPFSLDGKALQMTTSLGISMFPVHSEDADLLLQYADHAMYEAKQAGKNTYRVFSPQPSSVITAAHLANAK